jgi:predicted dehydrogenase
VHVLERGAWVTGFLDATPIDGTVRITVHRQVALAPADDQYFVRPPRISMLVSYLRMLGPRRVVRKVVSRRSEATRNDSWLTVGVGLTEAGAAVGFVAPAGPRAVERTVVPVTLCFPVDQGAVAGPVVHFEPSASAVRWAALDESLAAELPPLVGWRAETGTVAEVGPAAQAAIAQLVASPPPTLFRAVPVPPAASPVTERQIAVGSGASGPSRFHCFGYGQYAKTQVLPNLGSHVSLACVHEIDPLQIGPIDPASPISWDTSGRPRADEEIELAAVAGYHHTHAPLAVELLDRGARHVIIEKPIATSTDQLDALLAAMDRHPQARVHVAFQRRYSPFNAPLLADLGGAPVSMAATVYEVPLPARHWYRWPVVGGAVVSNGCHWIDHFLFLNGYAEVVRLQADRLASQIVLGIDLENGASCSISLRHEGAPVRGVRDLNVFWRGDATVTIEDMRRYSAERGFRSARGRRGHPYASLEAMYAEFGRRMVDDLPGDRPAELRTSAATTLELARLLDLPR